jgi:hypothetical protein
MLACPHGTPNHTPPPNTHTCWPSQAPVASNSAALQGRKLTDIINEDHENLKYFPGVRLPPNLVASSDLDDVVRDADVLVFCSPHQFMRGLVSGLEGKVRCQRFTLPFPFAPNACILSWKHTTATDMHKVSGHNISDFFYD